MTANVTLTNYLLLKRANTSVSSTYTGLVGEITIDTDLDTIRVHDGVTAGGHLLANVNQINDSGNLSPVNANVSAANIQIDSLRANVTAANVQITALFANAAAQQIQINNFAANTGFATLDQLTANVNTINANIGAFQTFSNANAGTQASSINNLNANIGAYQTYANANVTAIQANLGAYQTYANANAVAIQANLGAYQTYANSNAAAQANELNNIIANAGVQGTSINLLNANLTAANSAITTLTANAATQAGLISTVNANITAANAAITSLQSNAAVQQGVLDVLSGNAVTQTLELQQLTSNAAVQAANLTVLLANASAQEASLTVLVSNAASQATAIDNINANLGAYQTYANANAASQATNITTLLSNAAAQAQSLDSLTTNATTQGASIISIDANLGVATTNITALQSNAGAQGAAIDSINANVGAYQTYANANAATQATSIVTLTANAAAQQLQIDSFVTGTGFALITQLTANVDTINANTGAFQTYANANASTQATGINTINANLGSFQTYANLHFGDSNYGNTNVAAYLGAFNGNIIPAANVTYSLGDSTHQWKDLWVSNNTIYIGNTPVRVDGNTLLVNGAPVSGAYGNTQVAAYLPTYTGNITAGNLTITGNLSEGKIYGIGDGPAGDRYGYISWSGNSSGDGSGFNTMRLVPDQQGLEAADQYIIIDPTGGQPGHIHIRAGGTQDNSGAHLYLGGENSYVRLPAGLNPNVQIAANTHVWNFNSTGLYGELVLPAGEGLIRTNDDTVSLASFNTTTGFANTVYLGSGGGVGFFDSAIGGNWLEIFRSGTEPEIRVPVGRGNLNIQTNDGVTTYNWIFANTGGLTFPTGGNVTFDASAVSTIDGVTNINAVGTIGANVIQVLSDLTSFGASPAPVIYGFSSISTTGSAANEGNISASGNLVASQNAYVTGVVQAGRITTGNLTVTGNITQQSAYYETYANVTNSGGNLTCNFVNGGTFYATLTANVTANFTNVALTTGTIIGATIIVDQGATPYQISNVQVNGGGIQTVKWAGGVGQNPGTGSNTDVMSFSLINLGGGAWRVLGQIANYG